MQLKDKIIIVTGGGQGLGRAMAEHLAAKGARLALVDLNEERLAAAVTACKSAGGDARAYLCNVADEEQVGGMVAQVAEDFGGLDGLVNNAGILRDGLLLKVKDGVIGKMSLAQWQAVIDVKTHVPICAMSPTKSRSAAWSHRSPRTSAASTAWSTMLASCAMACCSRSRTA